VAFYYSDLTLYVAIGDTDPQSLCVTSDALRSPSFHRCCRILGRAAVARNEFSNYQFDKTQWHALEVGVHYFLEINDWG